MAENANLTALLPEQKYGEKLCVSETGINEVDRVEPS